mmetsp:Transcript_21497/g.47690  ORF Transcript_21497/g.47690 Transcript_21497/m.47690 type:complete len:713 (-) Transcript_21497:85-2223(-)
MPPLKIAGYDFIIAPDDLVFCAPASLVIHVLWAAADNAKVIRQGAWWLPEPTLLFVDAALCLVIAVVDLIITILSAHGRVMEKRRNECALEVFILTRVVIGLMVCMTFGIIAVWGAKELLWPAAEPPPMDMGGWGPSSERLWVLSSAIWALLLSRLLVQGGVLTLGLALLTPKDFHKKVATSSVLKALKMAGVRSDLISSISSVLMDVVGEKIQKELVPSDVAFGLLLVQASQRQGVLPTDYEEGEFDVEDEDPELELTNKGAEISMELSSKRACGVCVQRTFNRERKEDEAAMQDILSLIPHACGVYGATIEIFNNSVHPGTSFVMPGLLCSALWRALPCNEPLCCENTQGDLCFGLNQRALCRAVGATKDGPTQLLWATWENRGPGTSPPMSLVLDRTRGQLILAVRGTADLKDAIADAAATPVAFDPLEMAGWRQKNDPFGEDGLFAHATMVLCAQDALKRLEEVGVLEAALKPGGCAEGFPVVCCGHSLGAGVACLLALLLQKNPMAKKAKLVRFVGFEPPGGLLSKRLVKCTTDLGWISAVCAHDWVSRLSIRGVQLLRDKVIKELQQCARSKLQIAMLLVSGFFKYAVALWWFRFPIAALFQWLGGGPLKRKQNLGDGEGLNVALLDGKLWPPLYPPGHIAYFRPTDSEWWCCGRYHLDCKWTAHWVNCEDLTEIIVSLRSVELHFPNIIQHAYKQAAGRLGFIKS